MAEPLRNRIPAPTQFFAPDTRAAPVPGPTPRVEATLDQRIAPRFTLLIRAAKLIAADGEYLCIIRDASETGISVRTFHPLPVGSQMVIELQNGDRYHADLVWQQDDRAGFAFDQPADIARIIASPSRYSKRAIRVSLTAEAEIVAGGTVADATIRDISQQGAKIDCGFRLAMDQRVKLRAAGMVETDAIVRWRREGQCGLVFDETFQFGELARIVMEIQRRRAT
ncbi:PilZ domain-containing protein [Aurantiacibacter spongiae]|nr:PilZ domain-containing protein [Aurantiacibacter spongiae]